MIYEWITKIMNWHLQQQKNEHAYKVNQQLQNSVIYSSVIRSGNIFESLKEELLKELAQYLEGKKGRVTKI